MKKIGIITGASSGLGENFAKQIGEHFKLDELWLIARRENKLQILAENLKTKCKILPYDLRSESTYSELEKILKKEKPQIKILINNAGLGKSGLFKNLHIDHLKTMLKVNIYHPVILTHICCSYLEKGSCIINVSSAASFAPLPKFSVYSATKSFVTYFSRAINEELKRDGIKVMAVCPGPIATEFFSPDTNLKVNGLNIADAKEVVKKAFYDIKKNKKLSIYSNKIKLAYMFSYLLPNSLIEKLAYIFKEIR